MSQLANVKIEKCGNALAAQQSSKHRVEENQEGLLNYF